MCVCVCVSSRIGNSGKNDEETRQFVFQTECVRYTFLLFQMGAWENRSTDLYGGLKNQADDGDSRAPECGQKQRIKIR